MMSANLEEVIQRVKAGCASEADREAIENDIQTGRIVIANAPESVAIGGDVGDSQIVPGNQNVLGNGNIVIYEADAEIILSLLRSQPRGIPENLPWRDISKKFVGRENTLETLHQQLQRTEQGNMFAIVGMGGTGKTELALQYSYQYKQSYPGGICWLQARNGNIGTDIIGFGRSRLDLKPPEECTLAEQVSHCWAHWREGNVLIVLDDIHEFESIRPFLPPSSDPRFKTLITSRKQLRPQNQRLELAELDEPNALKMLESLLGDDRIQQEEADAKGICAWLGYLPLGIELVGRYLRYKPNLELRSMQQRLESQKLAARALRRDKGSQDEITEILGIETAFQLSWQELSNAAKEVWCSLGLLALAPISWSLIEQSFPEDDPEDLEEMRDHELLKLSLLKRVDSEQKQQGMYQLHPLLREFVQAKLETLDIADKIKRGICRSFVAVSQELPERPDYQQISNYSTYVPHAIELTRTLASYLDDADLVIPFIGLGRYYQGQGLYEQARSWYEECLSVAQSKLPSDQPDIALCYRNLGLVCHFQGNRQEAQQKLEQSLALRKQLNQENSLETADVLVILAAFHRDQGEFETAEQYARQALELREALLDSNHLDIAESLMTLATIHLRQQEYADAELLCLRALEIRKRSSNPNNPDIGESLNNLALLYRNQGRFEEAKNLFLEALEFNERILGKEHPNVAASCNNLASVYQEQTKYEDAEGLYLKAIEVFQKTLGYKHPNVGRCLDNLGMLYCLQDKHSEAEARFAEAIDILKDSLGVDADWTKRCQENLNSLRK